VERVLASGVDPQELNDPHLLAYWRSIRALAERVVATQVAVAAAAAAAYRGLEMFLEPHLDDAANAAQRLTAGGIEACGLKTSLDVCDLVQEGLGIDDVRIALEAADDPDTMRALLSSSEEGRQFIAAFRERLDRAGSAAIFAGPTWGEETAGAWNLLRQAAIVELGAGRPEMAADREEVLAEVIAEITAGKKWKVTRVLTGQIIDVRVRMLRRLVAEAVEFLQLRETTKLAVLRLGGDARRTVRTLAQRLAESGIIETEADADLLDVEELEAAFSGTPISRAVLDRRRRALETAKLVGPLPRLFSGRPDRVEAAVVADGNMVTGWAASPGLHRGRVRIITDIATTSSLEPGDVLVARATDPSWTPLFLTAGALIVEEGGPLSHAAIVARELGLPAVLNIEGITGLLVDGEEVTVDGTAGRILLHRNENVEVAA
jgi:pyruvate,water dikinase